MHPSCKHGLQGFASEVPENSFNVVRKFTLCAPLDMTQLLLHITRQEKSLWQGRTDKCLGQQVEVVALDALSRGFRVVRGRIVQLEGQ
jgi:hypothetical protein